MKFEPKVIVNCDECYESYIAADFDHLTADPSDPSHHTTRTHLIVRGRWQKRWDVYNVFSCSYLYCILYTEVVV